MATADTVLPIHFPRRRTADPTRRQRILQEKTAQRESGNDVRQSGAPRRSATVSQTQSRPHSNTRSNQDHGRPRRGHSGREKSKENSHLEEEEDDEKRPSISAPENAQS